MKEVVKKETNALMPSELKGTWGSENIDANDILIPRLLLSQAQSDFVAEGISNPGDIVKSTTKEIVGSKDKKCLFIPLSTYKTWIISEWKNGKFEFKSIEPMTPDNIALDREWREGDNLFRRDRSLNFYVLLTSEIERESNALKAISKGQLPDPDDCLLPCVLSFRRTSYQAGQDLITHFKKAEHFNLPAAVTTFKLESEFIKAEKGNYFVFRVEKSRKSTLDELTIAKSWYDTIKVKDLKIDDSIQDEEAGAVSNPNIKDDF